MVGFQHILVVCIGNICRSPVGEAMLKQCFPNKMIDSAGIFTERSGLSGKLAENTMVELAEKNQIDLSKHQAKQLTEEQCKQADLILVMEKSHIALVEQISPSSRGKIMLFAHWLGQKDIPDPYRQSTEVFEFVFSLLKSSACKWQEKLK